MEAMLLLLDLHGILESTKRRHLNFQCLSCEVPDRHILRCLLLSCVRLFFLKENVYYCVVSAHVIVCTFELLSGIESLGL